MVPLDAIKAPQGKKTLELGQSWPAKGRGRREGEAAPGQGLKDPCPDLNQRECPPWLRAGEEKALC